MSREYRRGLVGTVQSVLFEEPQGELYTGHAPNYMKVYAPGRDLHNRVLPARIREVYRDGLMGEVEEV